MAENKIEFTIEAKEKFKNTFSALNASLGALAVAAGGAVVTAILGATTKALDFASAIKETADRVDFSTDSLQRWRFVAEQSGGSAATLDNALSMFSRTIGEATAGSGAAQQAFARIGITLDELNNQAPEQIFERTRDAISEMTSASQRNQITFQLAGRQAKELSSVFSQTASEIDGLKNKATELGAVMDKETIEKAKKTKDELDAMTTVVKNQLATALVAVGPVLVKFAEGLAWITKKAVEATKAFGFFLGLNPITDPYDKLLDRFRILSEEIARVKKSGGIPSAMGRTEAYLSDLEGKLAAVQAELEKIRGQSAVDATPKKDPNKGRQAAPQGFLEELKRQADTSSQIKLRALENDRALQIRKLNEMNLVHADYKAAERLIDSDYANKRLLLTEDMYAKLGASSDLFFEARNLQLNEDVRNMSELGIQKEEILRYQAEQELQIEADKITQRNAQRMQQVENEIAMSKNLTDREAQIMREAEKFKQMSEVRKAEATRVAFGQMLNDLGSFNKSAFKAAKAYNIGVALMDTYSSFTKTMAAYPFPFNVAFAAASLAAGMAQVQAIRGQQYSGSAHAGLENVPNEGTFLLNKGERVLAPAQNQDLTEFLKNGGSSGGVNVGVLNITISVPDSAALVGMDRNEWRNIVAQNIIPAMDALNRSGIRPINQGA